MSADVYELKIYSLYGGRKSFASIYSIVCLLKRFFASSGNRTRAARVAGEHSTTEPTMLSDGGGWSTLSYKLHSLQIATAPLRFATTMCHCSWKNKNIGLPGGESNPGLPRDRRGY